MSAYEPAASPTRRRWSRAMTILVCVIVLAVVTAASARRKQRAPRSKAPRSHHVRSRRRSRHARAVVPPVVAATSEATEEHVHVRRGDTFESILAARGVGAAEATAWLGAAAPAFDLHQIRPRQGLTLRFDRETRALQAIRYEIDEHALLVVEQTDA